MEEQEEEARGGDEGAHITSASMSADALEASCCNDGSMRVRAALRMACAVYACAHWRACRGCEGHVPGCTHHALMHAPRFVYQRGRGGLLALRPTHPKKNLTKFWPRENQVSISGPSWDPPRPPASHIFIPYNKSSLACIAVWGDTGTCTHMVCTRMGMRRGAGPHRPSSFHSICGSSMMMSRIMPLYCFMDVRRCCGCCRLHSLCNIFHRQLQWCIGRGGTPPAPPPRCPAYAQPLSPQRQVPASMAFVTDSNRPQPLWQPPRTAYPTTSGAPCEVSSPLMHPWAAPIAVYAGPRDRHSPPPPPAPRPTECRVTGDTKNMAGTGLYPNGSKTTGPRPDIQWYGAMRSRWLHDVFCITAAAGGTRVTGTVTVTVTVTATLNNAKRHPPKCHCVTVRTPFPPPTRGLTPILMAASRVDRATSGGGLSIEATCPLVGQRTSQWRPSQTRPGRMSPRRSGPPLCDIPSGCSFFTGPWTVTHSSLRMLRRVAAFCRPLRPVLLLVSFPRWRSPVVGVLGLCWMWHGVPPPHQRPVWTPLDALSGRLTPPVLPVYRHFQPGLLLRGGGGPATPHPPPRPVVLRF